MNELLRNAYEAMFSTHKNYCKVGQNWGEVKVILGAVLLLVFFYIVLLHDVTIIIS